VRGDRNQRLQKLRSELTERSFAHLYESGGMRRVHLKGRKNILKRLLVHGAAFNLSLILRQSMGVGKPRRLQGLSLQPFMLFARIFSWLWVTSWKLEPSVRHFAPQRSLAVPPLPADSGIYQVICLGLAA
jgi:hypothetical protein